MIALTLAQLAQLLAGLKLLDRSDPAVQVELEATGENVIVCAGELHLERCLKDLRERFARIGIEASEPLVPYRETISALPSISAAERKVAFGSLGRILKTSSSLAIQIRVIPLPAKFRTFLMNNKMDHTVEFVEKMLKLWIEMAEEGEFNADIEVEWKTLLDRIVCFGPNAVGPNLLINNIPDTTMSLFNHPNENSGFEYESSIITAFQLAVASGPLCAEPVVGIAVLLENFEIVETNTDQTFLPGQILSAVKEAVKQGFLEWSPRLMLAMYTCDLQTDPQYLGKVDGVLSRRRGKILSEDIKDGSTIFTLGASLSVVESFGFVDGKRFH
jgi:ribosome assembly protein 1